MKITDTQIAKIGNEILPYASLYTWWLWLRSGGIIDQCDETFNLRFQLLNGLADLWVVIYIAVVNHGGPVAGFGERFGAICRKYHSCQYEKTKHRVHFESE